MTEIKWFLLSLWALGAIVVLINAPSCNQGWWSPLDRAFTAMWWPWAATAQAAHNTVSKEPRTLWCRNGVLVWHKPLPSPPEGTE